MRKKAWTALAVPVALLALASGAAAITNGSVDGTAHPNVGALYATAQGHPVPTLFCSGSLVAPGLFLTAAHCIAAINELPDTHFFVSFSPTPSPATLIEGRPTVDPLFGTTNGKSPMDADPHDMAVIRFDPNAPAAAGIRPVRLPGVGYLDSVVRRAARDDTPAAPGGRSFSESWTWRWTGRAPSGADDPDTQGTDNGKSGVTFVDVGYGLTDATADRDGIRRAAVSGNPRLKGDNWLVLSQKVEQGFGGTCTGDSGGPQFFGRVEVSITITGDRRCLRKGVNLRLDTASARAFLVSQGT